MAIILITNNPLVKEKLSDSVKVEYHNVEYLKILEIARDYIHKGNKLLTHPLSGSVKPNETPYKSIILECQSKAKMDMDSLMIIEQSIGTTKKFISNKQTPNWDDEIKEDFQTIDYSLIENVFRNLP